MSDAVTASHILVETEELAIVILEQVTSGERFAQLAQQHSKCPSGKYGGNLGQFTRGKMVKEFEDTASGNTVEPCFKVSVPVEAVLKVALSSGYTSSVRV